MTTRQLNDAELAAEAERWSNREVDLRSWEMAAEAVPRQRESVAISLRLPAKMLDILREFARRRGIGYQVLMKTWLDDRIRSEAHQLRDRGKVIKLHQTNIIRSAATFRAPEGAELKNDARK